MEATPELDAQVEEVATAVYGKRPSVTKLFSENNYVCRLDWDGFEPAVLKAAVAPHLHESVKTEAEVLGRLGSRGLPVPIVHFTEADAPSAPWPFFAGPFIDGEPLDRLCSERDPRAVTGCRAAGAFLARLHREPLSVLDGLETQHYPLLKRLDFNGQRWSAIREAGVDAARLAPVAEVINAAIARPERHLVHDSLASIHVRLGDREDVAILDWETVRPGFAHYDLAVLVASIRVFNQGIPDYTTAVLMGYATSDPPVDLDRTELDAWQVYLLLDWASFYLRTDRAELARQVIDVAMDNL